jgi:hypothetical protein
MKVALEMMKSLEVNKQMEQDAETHIITIHNA